MKDQLAGNPAPRAKAEKEKTFGTRSHVFLGSVMALLLVGGVGGWAATAQLTGAVIAQGAVTVDRNLKSIQHRDGGIVRDLAVREGDKVEAGQVLFQLEDVQTRAELSIAKTQLIELQIRKFRLLAERDLLAAIEFPRNSTCLRPRPVLSSMARSASSTAI